MSGETKHVRKLRNCDMQTVLDFCLSKDKVFVNADGIYLCNKYEDDRVYFICAHEKHLVALKKYDNGFVQREAISCIGHLTEHVVDVANDIDSYGFARVTEFKSSWDYNDIVSELVDVIGGIVVKSTKMAMLNIPRLQDIMQYKVLSVPGPAILEKALGDWYRNNPGITVISTDCLPPGKTGLLYYVITYIMDPKKHRY